MGGGSIPSICVTRHDLGAEWYGFDSGNVPKGRFPAAIRVLPFVAAVVGYVSFALVTGDPAAALMRAVVASDCSPNGSTVAMISWPFAWINAPNSVRVTE